MIFLKLPVTSSLDNCCIVSLFIRRLMGHMMSPLVSGLIRGQRAQTIAGLDRALRQQKNTRCLLERR